MLSLLSEVDAAVWERSQDSKLIIQKYLDDRLSSGIPEWP